MSLNRIRHFFTLAFALGMGCIALENTSSLVAQNRTLTVQGNAVIQAKPDQLVFSVTISKFGESTKAAKAEFDETKRGFLTAFNVMKFKGMQVKSSSRFFSNQPNFNGGMMGGGGMAVPVPFGGGGGAAPVAATQSSVTETFQLTVSDIEKLAPEDLDKQIMEYTSELKKLGLSTTGFSTRVQSDEKLKLKAFQIAMANARLKAETLAELSGGKVGKVVKSEEHSNPVPSVYAQFGMATYPNAAFAASGIASEIPITGNLRVTFELLD